MKYKIGDIFVCKTQLINHGLILEVGKSYKITNIYTMQKQTPEIGEYGYYLINNYYFYSEEEIQNYLRQFSDWLSKNNTGNNMSGMSGISPSAKLENHFYSIKELRTLKMKKLNERNSVY